MKFDTQKIASQISENPVEAMAAFAGLMYSIGSVVKAIGNSRGSHAYARDVNRRIRATKKKNK